MINKNIYHDNELVVNVNDLSGVSLDYTSLYLYYNSGTVQEIKVNSSQIKFNKQRFDAISELMRQTSAE